MDNIESLELKIELEPKILKIVDISPGPNPKKIDKYDKYLKDKIVKNLMGTRSRGYKILKESMNYIYDMKVTHYIYNFNKKTNMIDIKIKLKKNKIRKKISYNDIKDMIKDNYGEMAADNWMSGNINIINAGEYKNIDNDYELDLKLKSIKKLG